MQPRKPIPLTRIYKRTPCGRAVYGLACPEPCDGTCAALGVFLCAFGLADSPWTRAVDAGRDDGDDGALLAALAIAVAFGIDQPSVLPLAVARFGGRTPSDVLGKLVAALPGARAPEGCIVGSGAESGEGGHDLWTAMVRAEGAGHWAVLLRAAPASWMVVDLALPDAGGCDTRVATDVAALLRAEGLFFHFAQSQYKL